MIKVLLVVLADVADGDDEVRSAVRSAGIQFAERALNRPSRSRERQTLHYQYLRVVEEQLRAADMARAELRRPMVNAIGGHDWRHYERAKKQCRPEGSSLSH